MTYYAKSSPDAPSLMDKWSQPIKQDSDLKNLSLNKLNSLCPSTIVQLSHAMVPGMFVAGGSMITHFDPMHQFTDIDVWVNNYPALNHVSDMCRMWGLKEFNDGTGKVEAGIYDFQDELIKIQIIYAQGLKSIEDLVSTFDITACKIGFDEEKIVYGEMTQHDIQTKQIVCNPSTLDPVKLLLRIMKYVAKGYVIKPELVKQIWESNKDKVKSVVNEADTSQALLKAIEDQIAKNKQAQYPGFPTTPGYPGYGMPPIVYTDKTSPWLSSNNTWHYTCVNCGCIYNDNEVHSC